MVGRNMCQVGVRIRQVLILVLIVGLPGGLLASSCFVPEPVRVFSGVACQPWDRVELLEDPHPQIKAEAFASAGAQRDPSIVEWFGTSTPHSNRFLLHCAPRYAGKTLPTPILLVHGAGDHANRAWANPWMQEDPATLKPERWGMALWLSELGYSVFAITFAHRNGCNIIQAEQIANAITRIRTILKREHDPSFRVDIIAHSKGNLAARLYCSNAPAVFPDRPFLTPFRGDVRTWVAIGSPMLGMDSPFRYYGYNLLRVGVPLMAGTAPLAADRLLVNGMWRTCEAESYTGGGNRLWPGQAQCLYNLVRDGGLELTPDSYTPGDANMSMNALYHGGRTLFLASPGIDRAVAIGERFMYRLQERGLEPSVRLAVVAGSNPHIWEEGVPFIMNWIFFVGGMIQQTCSHVSDGAVFLKNATCLDGVIQRGAPLIGQQVFPMNHLDLTRQKSVIQWIDTQLMKK